jgi:lipid II:glycine glycyltransferase (peptidoglycan interpeptide bridge formation enzyme)
MFLINAQLVRRDCALVVPQQKYIKLRKGRKSEIVKARKAGVEVIEEECLSRFWNEVLEPRLEGRYSVKPVHSLKEISQLKSAFPKNIRQFSAYDGEQILAGVTIYETESVAHAQYSAVTTKGQELGALDYLFSWMIDVQYTEKRYFDFGISNEQAGRRLNFGLLRWKESFGARSYAHDFYRISSANYTMLDEVLVE